MVRERESGDTTAAALRGFGPLGILAFVAIILGNLVVVPLSAILVLLWAQRSDTPWREIGFVRPRNWALTLGLGAAFGVAFKFLMKALVMPLLDADPINRAYHHLVGNTAALPGMLYLIIVGAGFGEEIVFRGYMFERLGRLFGTSSLAKASIVLLSALWFGMVHYPEQGLPGAQQAIVVGIVFGAIFARTKSLALLMFAHAAFDLTALAIIYWNLESVVAHLVFR